MPDTKTTAAALEDPHADCPPAIWNGIEWECRGHSPAQPVPRVREAFVRPRDAMAAQMAKLAGGKPAPTAPVPAVRREDHISSELRELRAANDTLSAMVSDLSAELQSVQGRLATLEAAQKPEG